MQQTVTIGIAKQGHLSMYLNNKFLEKFSKIILLYKKCTNFRNQERAGDGILLPNLSQRKTYGTFSVKNAEILNILTLKLFCYFQDVDSFVLPS